MIHSVTATELHLQLLLISLALMWTYSCHTGEEPCSSGVVEYYRNPVHEQSTNHISLCMSIWKVWIFKFYNALLESYCVESNSIGYRITCQAHLAHDTKTAVWGENFCILWLFVKVYSAKLGGVGAFGGTREQSMKMFSVKIFFR